MHIGHRRVELPTMKSGEANLMWSVTSPVGFGKFGFRHSILPPPLNEKNFEKEVAPAPILFEKSNVSYKRQIC